jgi:hypothetical protein
VWKEDAVGGNSDAGGDHVEPQGHGPAGLIYRQGNTQKGESEQQPVEIAITMSPAKIMRAAPRSDTAIDKIQCAIEHGRPRHQDHAWADRDQAQ